VYLCSSATSYTFKVIIGYNILKIRILVKADKPNRYTPPNSIGPRHPRQAPKTYSTYSNFYNTPVYSPGLGNITPSSPTPSSWDSLANAYLSAPPQNILPEDTVIPVAATPNNAYVAPTYPDPGYGIGLGGFDIVQPSKWDIASDAYLNEPPQSILPEDAVVSAPNIKVVNTPNTKAIATSRKAKIPAKIPAKAAPVKDNTLSVYNIMDADKQMDGYGIDW
jgi:hypothetical protein